MSRIDDRLRYSTHPEAIQLCEELAEECATYDEGDSFGWQASLAEDRESRWREACW